MIYRAIIFRVVVLNSILSLLISLAYANENKFHISSEQWAAPRTASAILKMPAIVEVMLVLQSNKNNFLVIHHPGGDDGSLWAVELRGWLISLGLSGSKINLAPGSSDTKQIDLEILPHPKSASISNK